MNFDKILQKPFLISVFVFNIILFGVIVFLLGYVQNLLDSDSRNNLEEIVSQNKNVITSKLLLDLNRLDIISNKISDGLKNKNITKEADINKFLEDYSKNSIDDSLFLANKNGLAYVDGDTHIDISGRRYFKLAIDGISNISERTISRINGEYIFVGSVPLYYDNNWRFTARTWARIPTSIPIPTGRMPSSPARASRTATPFRSASAANACGCSPRWAMSIRTVSSRLPISSATRSATTPTSSSTTSCR